MKIVITVFLLLLLTSVAFGELTKDDIRTIIKEEVAASEKRMREYIDLKIETVNARFDGLEKSVNAKIDAGDKNLNYSIDNMDESFDPVWIVMIIVFTPVILPQLIILFLTVYDDIRERKIAKTEIRKLQERIEALSQQMP